MTDPMELIEEKKYDPQNIVGKKQHKLGWSLSANKDGSNGTDWGEMEKKFIGSVHPDPNMHCTPV